MSSKGGYYNRKEHICSKICSLLISLGKEPSKYEATAPKIEYWIEYVLREDFSTVDELVEGVSYVAWEDSGGSSSNVGRFLKEFYDAPHRSEQARTFVTQMCTHVLRWFAVASVEGVWNTGGDSGQWLSSGGGNGFLRAASFVGYLIKWELLSHELVQRHLTKSLTNHHHDNYDYNSHGTLRAWAIYNLFITAGSILLKGLLEPDDVQGCFDILDAWPWGKTELYPKDLKEFREIHNEWTERKEQGNPKEAEVHQGGGGEDTVATDDSAKVQTPVAFAPKDLPAAAIPFSILHDIESPSAFNGGDSSSETSTEVPSGTVTPTSSISTVSDLTPTELSEEIEKRTVTRHNRFYFEDGNVEFACGDTLFRVHSCVISFSSPKLREIIFQQAHHCFLAPEVRPRITISDSAEDFSIMLKMIYTPGFFARKEVPEFSVFASLLRMTTKYGFSNVRDQLIQDLEGAYPTKWEDFRGAKVLGEDVFGSPKPHPSAVLNLFESQGVRFAIPFAAYRTSIGGFQALMSETPGTVLSRRTFASTVQGMNALSASICKAARMVAYEGSLQVCPDKMCTLNVDTNRIEERVEVLEKVYSAMIGEREGGLLSPPRLGNLLCTKCAERVAEVHEVWGSTYWERLALVFGWDDL